MANDEQLVESRNYGGIGEVIESAGIISQEIRGRFGDPIEAVEIAKYIIDNSSYFIGRTGSFVIGEIRVRRFHFFNGRQKVLKFVEN